MPPTTILHLPASAPSPALANSSSSHPGGPHRKRWLIYFVTGNPGLVGYYDLFLAHLHLLLLAHPTLGSRHAFEIYGRSLSGFESRGSDVGTWPASIQVGAADERSGRKPPFGLQEQIDGVERALWDHVEEMRTREAEDFGDDENGPQILVIGHSVGAYITLEVMRRWRERLKNDVGCKRGVIQGGVCLFPTVTHIAKSSSGVKLTRLLKFLPILPLVAHTLARVLTFFIPTTILAKLLTVVLAQPPDAARTTARFLKSRHGVRQALHMAHDEMVSITHDAWDAEIWGAADPSPLGIPRPKLFFLFGKDDHWVADETRDELIKLRGRNEDEQWKPLMEVDETGLPHGFCIDPQHSIAVAEKVAEYIEEIIVQDD